MAQPVRPSPLGPVRGAPHSHADGRGLTSAVSRVRFVEELRQQGVVDERVLAVMAKVPRHEFVEPAFQSNAYKADLTLPIGHQQTLSQARVVGVMTQALLAAAPKPQRVLEVGTGSGYQTAILAALCDTVFTVERIRLLSVSARAKLTGMGVKNVHFGYADGSEGWPAFAPYDGIVVTAGADAFPPAMLTQLAPGGVVVIPVGRAGQQMLKVITRTPKGFVEQDVASVSFVPLLGGKA